MAVDYFLKIDGIPGESLDHKHQNEIDLESFTWGETQQGAHAAGGGGGAGKVAMQDFTFTMRVNRASPKLLLACATGQHIKEATLTARKAGTEQQDYLKVKFSDLLVSSFQMGGNRGDVIPVDQISLNFSKIAYDYKAQKPDGTLDAAIAATYDLKLMKAS
jgi:type VI secretion system secreted protein Hcp